ncbi:hypothetical protein RDABS01_023077 [Bienertia sinuspersici]
MAQYKGFDDIVVQAWRGSISGNPFKIIWEKSKLVKKALKQVHSQEFTSITSKIDKARDELTSVQQSLAQEPDLLELQEKEKICTLNLKKWLSIEESALRQKARIQWLKLGDSNERFFYSAVKARQDFNSVRALYSEQGQKLVDMQDIRGEFVKFYSNLLGSRSTELESIDLPTVRNGPQVSVQQCKWLIRPISKQEIERAVWDIQVDKAPGIDGFNSLFFRKTWHLIKEDIFSAVEYFFEHAWIYYPVNSTTASLVPKIANPSFAKEFRPIACCSTLYKIIAKILTGRLQKVINSVVCDSQAGFIPGRSIVDNVIMATELIKGYGRAHISPRATVKIDLRKAYDSVE